MALIPGTRYPAQTDAAAGYPQGKARNAGSFQDGTGTPLERDWVNDTWGFHQALLAAAGITPSGNPDEVGSSDYLTAIRKVADEQGNKAAERVMLGTWVDGGEIVASEFRAIAWAEAWGVFIVTSAAGNLYKSSDGATWTLVGAVLAARGLAVNPAGIGVAVGDAGAMKRSVDGTTWTTTTNVDTTGLDAVTWAGTMFVAVGDVGHIRASPDGTTWTNRSSGLATQLSGVASNGTLTVGVGAAGKIVTSTDSYAWTTRTSGVAVAFTAVAWDGALFVAVGVGGTIVTSPDGITWTVRTSGVATYLSAVAATDNYVIVGGASGVLLASSAGIQWTKIRHDSDAGAFQANALAWNGRVCVAAGSATAHGKISRSLPRLPL